MPELPEVTTTVLGLQRVLPGLTISSVWTDLAKKKQKIKHYQNTLKSEDFLFYFREEVVGAKVIKTERRAKNILIHLNNKKIILIHLKMTGHLIFGKYNFNKKENLWFPDKKERKELHDPYNRFVHVVFSFKENTNSLVFCDARKFGKVTLINNDFNKEDKHPLNLLGPEPLEKVFDFNKFKKQLFLKKNGKIKTVLMDQSVISGIGNIYSDEMLWLSSIHPESKVENIPLKNLRELYLSMKEVLTKGIKFGGDSTSDYRNIDGKKGNFQNKHNVYQKRNEPCGKRNCKGVIIRKVIGGRSSHFCNTHQKLY